MSAFIVKHDTINSIVTWLSREMEYSDRSRRLATLADAYAIQITPDDEESEAKLAQALFDLNCEAVISRYDSLSDDEREDMPKFTYEARYEDNRFQMLKSLHCWLYQCREGDLFQRPLYQFFERVAHIIAMDIIEDLPAYEAAKWD